MDDLAEKAVEVSKVYPFCEDGSNKSNKQPVLVELWQWLLSKKVSHGSFPK